MQETENVNEALAKVMRELPEEKAEEVLEFARSLTQLNSQLSQSDLALQQKALKKIWDHPEEDVYEL